MAAPGGEMEWRNEEFDLGGVNHLALVCSDMKRTVEFYTQPGDVRHEPKSSADRIGAGRAGGG